MAMRTGGSEESLKIKGRLLLLVEGVDEERVLCKLIDTRVGDTRIRREIQIIPAGGRRVFRRRLMAISVLCKKRGMVKGIGIVRDADDDPRSAFQSVANDVKAAGLRPPGGHGEYSGGEPATGIYIMPDGSSSGALETLIRRSVNGDATATCVNAYLTCLSGNGILSSKNEDKSFVHAYLAATRDPVARVGEGAQQGVWDFSSKAFDPLTQFLHELISEHV